jgi:hypothetical protein
MRIAFNAIEHQKLPIPTVYELSRLENGFLIRSVFLFSPLSAFYPVPNETLLYDESFRKATGFRESERIKSIFLDNPIKPVLKEMKK